MQTFLPYADYQKSARCLDKPRLGKQRVEVQQIFNVLRIKESIPVEKIMVNEPKKPSTDRGWLTHSAVRMWDGRAVELLRYGVVVCAEFRRRGGNDNLMPMFLDRIERLEQLHYDPRAPFWMGDESVHASHRANLLRKNSQHYSQFGWVESAELPYVWPA